MKILHLIDTLGAGGKERQLVELLKGLSENQEISPMLAVMSKDIHFPDVHRLNINIKFLIRKTRRDPRILKKLYKLCKDFRPDIIHSWSPMTSVYAVPVAKILNIKLINGSIRDAPPFKFFHKSRIYSKITFLFSDAVVANSCAGLKAYKAPMHKSVCIHNGFDFNRVINLQGPEHIRKKFHINTEKVVGMVGEFSNRKDYKTYIAAAESILATRNNVTFLAVGGGENLQKYRVGVKDNCRDKIIFIGNQTHVESIINIFSVGVLCTAYTEGISNSIMEYMALGKPVVATDTEGGGTGELLIDGKTGFLVSLHDSETLSKRILQLLDDNQLATSMGMEGRKRIEEDFNMGKMTNSYLALYRNVIEGNFAKLKEEHNSLAFIDSECNCK